MQASLTRLFPFPGFGMTVTRGVYLKLEDAREFIQVSELGGCAGVADRAGVTNGSALQELTDTYGFPREELSVLRSENASSGSMKAVIRLGPGDVRSNRHAGYAAQVSHFFESHLDFECRLGTNHAASGSLAITFTNLLT
jgi:hypothetical protein